MPALHLRSDTISAGIGLCPKSTRMIGGHRLEDIMPEHDGASFPQRIIAAICLIRRRLRQASILQLLWVRQIGE